MIAKDPGLTTDTDSQEDHAQVNHHDLLNSKHALLIDKNKKPRLRKGEDNCQNKKHPQKCPLGFFIFNSFTKQRERKQVMFQKSKEVKERAKIHQNKQKNPHTHNNLPLSHILPSNDFFFGVTSVIWLSKHKSPKGKISGCCRTSSALNIVPILLIGETCCSRRLYWRSN